MDYDSEKALDSNNLVNKDINILKHFPAKLRVLFIQHELFTWNRARQWGYMAHLGYEEALKANDVEVTTLLTTYFPRAKEICKDKKFDQIWINDITHSCEPGGCGGHQLTEEFMEWISTKAPVRLGFLIESLKYNDDEYASNPSLYYASSVLKKTINYITHILVPDEVDLSEIKKFRDISSMWYIPCIPERYITREIYPPLLNKAMFCGTIYGERAKYMKLPILKELISCKSSPENFTDIPNLFDSLHGKFYTHLLDYTGPVDNLYNDYVELIRLIRRKSFEMYLDELKKWALVIQLPSFAKIHTGRIYEVIASGRPIISIEHSNHPLNNNLFEHGKEILFYPKDNPSVLADHIKFLLNNPDLAFKIALNARDKLLNFHTSEKRVEEFITWTETGKLPDYNFAIDTGITKSEPDDKIEIYLSDKTRKPDIDSEQNYSKAIESHVKPISNVKKLRILFISPPYARFMSLSSSQFLTTFGNMATILSLNGHLVRIYDADFDVTFRGITGTHEYIFTNQHKISEALYIDKHYVWKEIEQVIKKFNPDVVGITTMTNKYPMSVRIAEIVKKIDTNIKVVIGGHHASIFGVKLLENKNIDFSVIGEGEMTFLELINRLCETKPDFSRVNGLIYKYGNEIITNPPREFIINLDSLPISDRSLMLNPNYFSDNIIASRGCPFNCTYCGAQVIWTHKVRKRSIKNIIEEINYLFQQNLSRNIYFSDDSFTYDKKFIQELAKEFKKIDGLTYSCISRLDLLDSVILEQLKESGCNIIFVGIESGNDNILKLMNKKISCDKIKSKIELINSFAIPLGGFFMMGYPGETKENILETLNFMKELNLSYSEINIFNPLPGTKIWNELEKEGLVSSDMNFAQHSQGSFKNFFVNDMSDKEFKELALFMAKEFDRHNRRQR